VTTALERLRKALAEIDDLKRAAAVLEWDMETYMPSGGVQDRAVQLGTLKGLAHERFVSDQTVRLLEAAESEAEGLAYDSDEASLVRVTRRDLDLDTRIPAELIAEAAEVGAAGRSRWQEARQRSEWSIFEPSMRKTVEITRRMAEAIGYAGRPYDALLARTEPGLSTAQVEVLFAELKAAILPLLQEVLERADRVDDSVLDRELDPARQLALSLQVAHRFGFDPERGRQDLSAHPFCVPFGPGDVRFTTRVRPTARDSSLFSSMHETGHAVYYQGIPRSLERTPLWDGASGGLHESQSRLWENLVGRSRAFWTYMFPILQATFPVPLAGVEAEAYYRAVNRVRPSYIRVDADEVTYNLHIMLRFEIENDLLEGRLEAEDVPEAWTARLREYLGLPPPPVVQGPLQDIHWSEAPMGSFVSYTLGNVISAQLMETVRAEIPDLDGRLRQGEFGSLLEWLQRNVYVHGRKFTPQELLQRVTGHPLTPAPWIAYTRQKFRNLYQ
jgi:carboxypeptidase Taq